MEATISNFRRKKNVVNMAALKDWSSLHQDFISCFAHQIVSIKDFFAFRGVCKSWRSTTIKENSNTCLRLQHKVPILILSKEINAPIRNFYSLTEGQISQLDLPETMGQFCYSSLGWVLTVSQDYSKLDLFNPLTHAHIELPAMPRTIFSLRHLKKFLLSSSPSWTSDYGVILLSYHCLTFYKPGYNNGIWTLCPVPLPKPEPTLLVDAIYYKGQFYAVDYRGKVLVCEIEDPNNAQMRFVAPEIPRQLFGHEIHFVARYLVESTAETLLLVLTLFEDSSEVTTGCRVFKVPIDTGNSWAKSEVKSLGNRTLFVGANNSSFWIEPLDDSVCKANYIYFLNRSYVSPSDKIDIGIYYMEDGKIDKCLEQLPDFKNKLGRMDPYLTSHSWLQPSF